MPSAIRLPLTGAAILGGLFLLYEFGKNAFYGGMNLWFGLPTTPLELICIALTAIGVLYIVGAIAEAN